MQAHKRDLCKIRNELSVCFSPQNPNSVLMAASPTLLAEGRLRCK